MRDKIEEKVMSEIKSGKVRMKPRYYFIGQKLSLIIMLVVLAILAIVFTNLTIYILRQNGTIEFLEFGLPGLVPILENIPISFIIWSVIFFVLSWWIFKQFDLSYKKPSFMIASAFVILVFGVGFLLAGVGINDFIRKTSLSLNPVINHAFELASTKNLEENQGILAIIEDTNSNYVLAKTSTGKMLILNITEPKTTNFEEVETAPYEFSGKPSFIFNNAELDKRFNEMRAYNKAVMAKLNKITAEQLDQSKNEKMKKGQIIKIIGVWRDKQFYPKSIMPVNNYNLKKLLEN